MLRSKRIYSWLKQTIERSFTEAKVNHGLRYARMLGIRNMREQAFLTAVVQNIRRIVLAFLLPMFEPTCIHLVDLSVLWATGETSSSTSRYLGWLFLAARIAAGRYRQGDCKLRPLTGFALDVDRPAAQLNDAMYQRQAKPISGRRMGGIRLIELIKNVTDLGWTDADALVPNGHPNAVRISDGRNKDTAVFMAEFNGIADEIRPKMVHHFQIVDIGQFW